MIFKNIGDFLIYTAIRAISGAAGLVSMAGIRAIARFFAPIVSKILAGRNRLVKNNLNNAFPELDSGRIDIIARDFWLNITTTALEVLKAPFLQGDWILDHTVIENGEALDLALGEGRGVLIHSGHFGNTELAGQAITFAGYPLAMLARVQKNPYLDRWHNQTRRRFGMRIFTHHQAVKETQDWLRSNGCLGILTDHNLYKGGIFVDFFGRPAATATLTALLHWRTKSPIIGVYPARRPGGWVIRMERINAPRDLEGVGPRERTRILTQYLTDCYERWIREDPANWLWGHDRWKRAHEALAENSQSKAGSLT